MAEDEEGEPTNGKNLWGRLLTKCCKARHTMAVIPDLISMSTLMEESCCSHGGVDVIDEGVSAQSAEVEERFVTGFGIG